MHVQTAPLCAWRGIDLLAAVLTGSPSAVATLLCVLKNPVVSTSSVVKVREMVTFGGDSLKKSEEKRTV